MVKKALGLNDRASSSEHKSWADLVKVNRVKTEGKVQHYEASWARSRMYLSNSSLEWKVGMKRILWVGGWMSLEACS